jgi:hypothetical protein
MSDIANDPEHWRRRAEEARMNAKSIPDPDAKRRMLDVAVSYERLAEKAEERNRSLQGIGNRYGHGK